MTFQFDLLAILTFSGIIQGIVFAGALIGSKRGYPIANRILAAFLMVVSISIGGLILAHTKYVLMIPHLAEIHVPFGSLIAPLFFLYVRTIVLRESALRRSDLLHFTLFLLLFIYLLPFYVQSGEDKISYLKQALDNYPLDWRVRTGVIFAQSLIYLGFTYFLLLKKEKRKNLPDTKSEPNLYFAYFFTSALSIVWIIGFIRFIFAHRLETNLLAPFVGCAFICGLVFKVLQRPEVLDVQNENTSRKYEKSTFRSDETEAYLKKIIVLMETERLFLDKNLTLEKTAKKLSILPLHLSQLINARLNQNFSDFINSYRVDEFKRRITDPQNNRYTIVAIAEASGFNSKSTFNTAFKKHTNLTPTEYKKKFSAPNL